jgi:hypothetical protein
MCAVFVLTSHSSPNMLYFRNTRIHTPSFCLKFELSHDQTGRKQTENICFSKYFLKIEQNYTFLFWELVKEQWVFISGSYKTVLIRGIADSHAPWLIPSFFLHTLDTTKWKLTLLKVLFHYLLPLSEFVRAWGCALKAQRKQVNPLREELYNEQMSK